MVLINPMQTIFHPWIFQEFKVETDLKLRLKLVQTCHMTSLHCETSFVRCKLVFSCPNESNIDQKKNQSADKHRKKEKSENTVKIHFCHMVQIHMTSIRNANIKTIFFVFTLLCTQTKPNRLKGPVAKIQLSISNQKRRANRRDVVMTLAPQHYGLRGCST